MNPEAIIECVPNFSEGADAAKVSQIVASMQVEGVRLLDWSLDKAHNRSVVTIAGTPAGVLESAVRAAGKAAELIDLTKQNGVHPRIGAADVIPFIPVSGTSLAECAVLARQAGLLIWRRYGVPVYFYGAAAARPDRVQLEDVRKGQFEGLRDASRRDVARRPDIGGPELHETAGASAVGARSFLIAYNVHLREPDVSAARAIARDLRAANGGLNGVKALGVLANGRAQVTMNITDFNITPMRHVHATIQHLAQRHGVLIDDAELIGLIPQAAYEPGSDWVRQIHGFDPDAKVLERRLHAPIAWPDPQPAQPK
jgi:glutamate formiminotransferase / 5-formyltetrahydrofolate cyclo-ligase